MSAQERTQTAAVPRLALTREEAAASVGMSLDSFERHVQPGLRLIRLGRMVLVRPADLDAFLERQAQTTLATKRPIRGLP